MNQEEGQEQDKGPGQDPPKFLVRCLRLMEYLGTPEWINHTQRSSLPDVAVISRWEPLVITSIWMPICPVDKMIMDPKQAEIQFSAYPYLGHFREQYRAQQAGIRRDLGRKDRRIGELERLCSDLSEENLKFRRGLMEKIKKIEALERELRDALTIQYVRNTAVPKSMQAEALAKEQSQPPSQLQPQLPSQDQD